ncbi:ubiquitin carboxyl-terminal hydrolase [Rhizoctonia solani]|uniref:ubiquitinyl hydrolase 1 n=1 Tax=Rhizoctonia solani TaxID=456999 RepID=A0A8H8STF3_9AGAM|nr:ubiquitin carboxyl-terminal hydrolase [Rhizoctonia solani]QRW16242.1 ubiquitin carboxyl-terminal hydrolase [Rhizoctonia solani]
MRQGRQEDAHEFLRYSVDALQRSALADYSSTSPKHPNPNKIPHALAETSWVHAIFGGRLRSRVSCRTCHYCSDTFDSLLDLSVEINRSQSLLQALGQFVKPEILSGEDAYRCEKCKKPVTAEKFMTKGKKYVLNGVINHLGSGPNSGHYTAHVRGADGRWTSMDDELVSSCSGPPLNHKNAYVLFYIQSDKAHPIATNDDDDVSKGLGGQKRSRDDMESGGSRPAFKPNGIQVKTQTWDPFPPTKKSRIEDNSKAKQGLAGPSRPVPVGVASTFGSSLVSYRDSDDIEDEGEVVEPNSTNQPASHVTLPGKSTPNRRSDKLNSTLSASNKPTTQSKPNSPSTSKAPNPFSPTKATSFYGSSQKKSKRLGTDPYLEFPRTIHAKRDSSTSDIQKQMGFTQFGQKPPRMKERMKGKKSF